MLILIKLLFVLLGGGIILFSKHIPYKWVQPKPSQYIVTDKNSYMKDIRRLLWIIGIYYILIGLLYLIGFENIFFVINIPLVPVVLLARTNRALKKYYKRIAS